jgi:putative hemolysin
VPLLVSGLLFILLLLLLAVISATETAIHSARDLEERLEREGEGSVARKLRSITANPFAQLHRTLLLSATLNLALAALGLHLVSGPLLLIGWNPWMSSSLLLAATVMIGDVLPKFFAAYSPSAVLLGSLRLLDPLRSVLDPVVNLADRTTDALIGRMVPKRVKARTPITRDEFETLVEMREEQGLLDSAEADMIREALDIERLTVRDCMVPRVDLTLMSAEDGPVKAEIVLDQSAGRWVVVYGETPDIVVGVIDVVAWRMAGRPVWSEVVQKIVFVPETMNVMDALEKHLKDSALPLLIVDEYGGLEGMVSQEEIADWLLYEAAPWQGEAGEIRELSPGRYLIDGGTRLDDVCSELQLILPAGGIDTIGGFVFNQIGHVPKAGERIKVEGGEFKVRRVVRARIQQVELRMHQLHTTETEEDAA